MGQTYSIEKKIERINEIIREFSNLYKGYVPEGVEGYVGAVDVLNILKDRGLGEDKKLAEVLLERGEFVYNEDGFLAVRLPTENQAEEHEKVVKEEKIEEIEVIVRRVIKEELNEIREEMRRLEQQQTKIDSCEIKPEETKERIKKDVVGILQELGEVGKGELIRKIRGSNDTKRRVIEDMIKKKELKKRKVKQEWGRPKSLLGLCGRGG